MFLPFSADPNTSSLLENKVKSEINSARAAILSANYKTRLVVVILGESPVQLEEVEERLAAVRRVTSLDQKALYYIPYGSSRQEVESTLDALFTALHPQCLEYYRDLSKHARRKRNRNATPQPTIPPSNAHVLSSQGWIVRYEFKLGVFAEFRQEMDAACRNYEAAYESLFSPEVIESIASWNPRFMQARLLADVISLRILRCLLWTGQTTAAVKAWSGHRDRIEGVLNRRSNGTEDYGWEAWQSTWSKTMSDLLTRSELAGLNAKMGDTDDMAPIFVAHDNALTERFGPWESLHHQGYWLKSAHEHTKRRRSLAMALHAREATRTVQSPKSPSHAQDVDSYFALKPWDELPSEGSAGFDYRSEMFSTLDAAVQHFANHGQLRMQEYLQLKRVQEHLSTESWSDVVEVLQPFWDNQTWRGAGWWQLLECTGWTLLDCAKKSQQLELVLRLTWELGNAVFAHKEDAIYDLGAVLVDQPSGKRVSVAMSAQDTACRLSSSFAFSTSEGHVGEPIDCQLVLSSCTLASVPATTLSQIKIVFEGSLKPLYLTNQQGAISETQRSLSSTSVSLVDSSQVTQASKRTSALAIASVSGEADLVVGPGQTKVFNFRMTPREAGEVSVASITMMIEQDNFSLTMTNAEVHMAANVWWEVKNEIPTRRDIGVQRPATSFHVLPKPPKVEINATNYLKAYYTNEEIHLEFDIVNNEDEAAHPRVQARLISPVAEAARARWSDQVESTKTEVRDVDQLLPIKPLGRLDVGAKSTLTLQLSETVAALDHELEIVVTYHLDSDVESVLQKALVLDIGVIRPFEANYDFNPRLIKDAWPNYFAPPPGGPDVPSGLTQQYLVAANLFSFAIEPVEIEAILLTTTSISGGAICSSSTGVLRNANSSAEPEDVISTHIKPEETRTFNFDLTVQKLVLADRDAVVLDLALEIGWRRPGSKRVNSSILEVPRFVIPMAEPRVLLTIDNVAAVPGQDDMKLISLRYTIENPSMHFLTFNIAMEASEEFAFSGPKASSVSLVPISKHETVYSVLPNRKDTESSRERRKDRETKSDWLRVHLSVVDAYFNQTLRVQPAGEGVRLDRKGGVVVQVG